jgi:hypothetical protein
VSAAARKLIREECRSISTLLCKKNRDYGDSALHPIRIFARGSAQDMLRARIDDKLARIARGNATIIKEDTIQDLIGYLVLFKIARRLRERR